MPRTPAQKQATDRYRTRNGRAQVNLELTPENRRHWQAYAESRGMSLTAMARECVERCMAQDGFVPEAAGEPAAAPAPSGMPAAAGAPRPVRAQRGIEVMEGMD